tara:strand:- start:739 stop:1983 length:1245 start_codon:yes stop_codon:yes gene_type:complete
MHKFIFSQKDSWISELTASQNHGGDEVLELQKYFNTTDSASYTYGITRILTQFDITDISKSMASSEIHDAKFFLRLYSTDSSHLSANYSMSAFPLSGSWEEGTGKNLDNPIIKDGVSWKYTNSELFTTWSFGGGAIPGITVSSGGRVFGSGSESNGSGSQYGGVWYTGSGFHSSQSFNYESPDINMDVTNIVYKWISGSAGTTYPNGISNNGFILIRGDGYPDREYTASLVDSNQENDNSRQDLKFFSRNTNTIYPPKLEVRWNDSVGISTGVSEEGNYTSSFTALDMSGKTDNYIYMRGLRPQYKETETVKFRVGARKRFIGKTFSTSVQNITGSYISDTSGSYSIRDLSTDEIIIPFSEYTYLSLDSGSMYFKQDLNTFQPGRVYKILIRVKYDDNQEIIYDDDSFQFKIVR